MADMNFAVLSGGVTGEPQFRAFPGGGGVLEFSVCSNDWVAGKDGAQGEERPNYVDVKVYGPRAERLAAIVRRGMRPVSVCGRLRQESWEKDGQRRSKLVLVADEVVLPPRPRDGEREAPQAPQGDPYGVQAALEAQGVHVAPGGYAAQGYQAQGYAPAPVYGDPVPF